MMLKRAIFAVILSVLFVIVYAATPQHGSEIAKKIDQLEAACNDGSGTMSPACRQYQDIFEKTVPSDIKELMYRESALDDKCKGGSGGERKISLICAQRDKLYSKIKKLGWCWGHIDQASFQQDWVVCAPGD